MGLGFLLMSKAFCSLPPDVETDNIGRVIKYPGKTAVSCPIQDNKTAVILVIGQSNSANHGEKIFTTKYPDQVFNYFEGKCYIASSPLLGSTGIQGEFITPMADQLIANGDYEKIVIISFGIGGTTISLWEKGAIFNNILQKILFDPKLKFNITDIIWHQGESDFNLLTTTEQYTDRFHSLINSIRKPYSSFPNVYLAVATKCGENPDWKAINAVSIAQKYLEDKNHNIFLGANTDDLLLYDDRDIAHCHFSESGQIKTANAYAESIHRNHNI